MATAYIYYISILTHWLWVTSVTHFSQWTSQPEKNITKHRNAGAKQFCKKKKIDPTDIYGKIQLNKKSIHSSQHFIELYQKWTTCSQRKTHWIQENWNIPLHTTLPPRMKSGFQKQKTWKLLKSEQHLTQWQWSRKKERN